MAIVHKPKNPLPLAILIATRMADLDIDRETLGFRLGYRNPLKAAGRVDALCAGHINSNRSQRALRRLPEALEVPTEAVRQAVVDTDAVFTKAAQRAEEERRLAREEELAEWRAAFVPHAVLQTERTMPSSITMCGMSGGIDRWLMIDLDASRPPVTFVRQVLDVIPDMASMGDDGRRYVTFFGEAMGFVINFTPDRAVRYDLDGRPLEVLAAAYRPGEIQLSLGGRPVSPTVMERLLSGYP